MCVFNGFGVVPYECVDQPLFTNHQRGKLTRAGVTYILKKYFDAARQTNPHLPTKISPHILRHTFATVALQNGVDIKTVSGMLGHYSAGFTLDTYAHVTTQAQRQAANTMANILSGAVEN